MNSTELQVIFEDLMSRFIINVPEQEIATTDRICFQIEQAHWYYEDFIRETQPHLPGYTLKRFAAEMFQRCPLLRNFLVNNDVEEIYKQFIAYKMNVPVCGSIILNETLDKVLLVRGWNARSSWTFPKGKINKDESDVNCAIRETIEEIGFDVSSLIQEQEFIEVLMRGEQRNRLFIIPDIPESTQFQTRTRKEIGDIKWHCIADLPRFGGGTGSGSRKSLHGQLQYDEEYKFYMIKRFMNDIIKWIAKYKRHKKRLKKLQSKQTLPVAYSSSQSSTGSHMDEHSENLKALLGIGGSSVSTIDSSASVMDVNGISYPHRHSIQETIASSRHPSITSSFEPVGSNGRHISRSTSHQSSLLSILKGESSSSLMTAASEGLSRKQSFLPHPPVSQQQQPSMMAISTPMPVITEPNIIPIPTFLQSHRQSLLQQYPPSVPPLQSQTQQEQQQKPPSSIASMTIALPEANLSNMSIASVNAQQHNSSILGILKGFGTQTRATTSSTAATVDIRSPRLSTFDENSSAIDTTTIMDISDTQLSPQVQPSTQDITRQLKSLMGLSSPPPLSPINASQVIETTANQASEDLPTVKSEVLLTPSRVSILQYHEPITKDQNEPAKGVSIPDPATAPKQKQKASPQESKPQKQKQLKEPTADLTKEKAQQQQQTSTKSTKPTSSKKTKQPKSDYGKKNQSRSQPKQKEKPQEPTVKKRITILKRGQSLIDDSKGEQNNNNSIAKQQEPPITDKPQLQEKKQQEKKRGAASRLSFKKQSNPQETPPQDKNNESSTSINDGSSSINSGSMADFKFNVSDIMKGLFQRSSTTNNSTTHKG